MSSSELSPYVELEEFGVVTLLFDQGFCEIEPERTERRYPVYANADGDARLGRIAQKEFLEAGRGIEFCYVDHLRRIGDIHAAIRLGAAERRQPRRPRPGRTDRDNVGQLGRGDV